MSLSFSRAFAALTLVTALVTLFPAAALAEEARDEGEKEAAPASSASSDGSSATAPTAPSPSGENEAPTAIDKYGKTLFTLPNAEHVNNFREGLAAFSTVSDSDGEAKWGFVNKEGKVLKRFAPNDKPEDFAQDIAAVLKK